MSETNEIVAELKAHLLKLEARVQILDEEAARRHPEVSEDVMLAIAAACAAYLGKRATVKQVRLHRAGGWASQGRASVQQSHGNLHGTR
jgi:methylmalonyl-CoA carboxyltransferase large subunit